MGLCSNVLFNTLCTDLALFDQDLAADRTPFGRAEPWPGLDQTGFACLNLRNTILSKYTDGVSSASAERAALDLFLHYNAVAESWCDPSPSDDRDATLLGIFEDNFSRLTDVDNAGGYYDRDRIYEKMNVGPGSSVGVDGTSYYEKVALGRPTCTSKVLYEYYSYGASPFSLESEVEGTREYIYGEVNVVQGSNMSFAPKKREIARVICTEPSVNMLLQKGLGACLETVLLDKFGIDLSTQPVLNRHLAWLGSWSGLYGTIDLRSASDLISMGFLRRFSGTALLRMVERFRSQRCRLPDGSYATLHMVSTMGNGFTFPLQTLIFATVVKAAYEFVGLPLKRATPYSPGNFGVFGDDIVVEASAYTAVSRLLTLLGHEINCDKSFNEGAFRESCGGDFLTGVNVRGVYLKSPLDTPQSVYKLHNRLQKWSLTNFVQLDLTLHLLRSSAPNVWVPPYENDDAGFQTVYKDVVDYARNGMVAIASCVATRSTLYSAYRVSPVSLDLSNVGRKPYVSLAEKRKARKRGKEPRARPHNHAGILLSVVRGTLRDGRLCARSEHVRYQQVQCISPGWDWHGGAWEVFDNPRSWAYWVTNGYATSGSI